MSTNLLSIQNFLTLAIMHKQQLQLSIVASCTILNLGLFLVLCAPMTRAAEDEDNSDPPVWSHFRQTEWPKLYSTCGTRRQSPIDIQTNDVVVDNKRQLKLMNYNETVYMKIKTSEYSLRAVPNEITQVPALRPSWLYNEYELTEVHFHWGDGSSKPFGSEHLINTVGGSAEMHLVHLKKGLAIENITGVDDALVVVGVLLKLGPITNREVANFVAEAESNYSDETNGWVDGMLNLLPPINQRSFYTYPGSLTTPPCQEVVTWIVMHSPINISQEKLVRLTNLVYSKNNRPHVIGETYRMVQPLNQRIVYMSNNITQS